MASIQQSFNQMLMSAQVGTGLFAHTEQGKALHEEAKAKRVAKEKAKAKSEEAKEVLGEQEKTATQKAFSFYPTAERAETVAKYKTPEPEGENPKPLATGQTGAQGFGSAGNRSKESKMIRSLYERGETLSNQKQVVKDRISILGGSIDNSIWEEYLNG